MAVHSVVFGGGENGEEGNWPEFYGGKTRDGKEQIQVGNLKNLEPGGEHTFMSYGLPWANTSNSPFRLFKSFVHEGEYQLLLLFIGLPSCRHQNTIMQSTTKRIMAMTMAGYVTRHGS